ncbi:unconventional myosin-XVB-like [Cyanistes caeruleus]|uniref:unconventional myosin-XVB-like n=1 Tax=Cyanistes caeruleus TaxID=156563 RepID=UPI000CDB7C2A|nr:unconventional myosin-XVB-like [Cyanistes caeruleus]
MQQPQSPGNAGKLLLSHCPLPPSILVAAGRTSLILQGFPLFHLSSCLSPVPVCVTGVIACLSGLKGVLNQTLPLQVHKFLSKNRDQLRPEVLDIFSQSRLKVVSHIFQRAKAAYGQQRELWGRGKGLRPQASTLVSKFQQSLEDLTAKLRGSHAFFIRCITPNPRKVGQHPQLLMESLSSFICLQQLSLHSRDLNFVSFDSWRLFFPVLCATLPCGHLSNIFDVEYVSSQLRHSGILEAIHIRKEGYPVRLPFQSFLARYGFLAGSRPSSVEQREGCAAVLARVVGSPSDLYQIGVTKN